METTDSLEAIEGAELTREAIRASTGDGDGHPGWQVTLYATWVAQLLAMVGFAFVMPFMPFYIRELGVRDERLVRIWAGLLVTGSGLMMSLAAPFWGWVADHYGRKAMVQRAMFGGSVILTLMAYARNVHHLFALRTVQGAVTGTVSASTALVSSVVPRARLGFSLGLMQTAVFAGSSAGPLLGGVIADHYGYRFPFKVTGALLLLGGLLVLFGAKERFQRPTAESSPGASTWEILRAPAVRVLLLVYLLMSLSGSFVGAIFPLFVEEVLQRPKEAASATGLIFAVTGVVAALSSVGMGRLSDQLGHKRVLILCTVFAGLVCVPQYFVRNFVQLLVMRALSGFAAGGMMPAMSAMVATTVPRDGVGRAYGFTATASALGWAIGPMLGGLAASAFGLRVPFLIMAGLLVGVSVVAERKLRPVA